MDAPRLTRRRFLLGAASASLAASSAVVFGCQARTTAQSGRGVRVGWLALTSAEDSSPYVSALRAGLQDLGYVDGRNLVLEERYADRVEDQLPQLARDLVRDRVEVLVTSGTEATLAAIRTTSSVPVVFTNVGDPLGSGLVYSLSRPGANATGVSSVSPELAGKRLELLKVAVPRIARVAVLWSAGAEQDVLETRTSASWLGVQVEAMPPATPDDIQTSLQAALAAGADALVAISTPIINTFNAEIARFASSHNLPSIAEQRDFVAAGGLLAYGAQMTDLCRRAATFIHKIRSGTPPADLPVERADRFDLAVNLKTAQLLKLVLPEGLLLQAAEVVL
jgi:putative ABC transport system substrate-binding protein